MTASDSFGSGGPGTPPDFVSDDYVRVLAVSAVGGTNRYAASEYFRVRQGMTEYVRSMTFGDTPPRKAASLAIVPQTRLMSALGQTNRLQVIATYADGTTGDVTPRSAWTSYRISNPVIATVDPDGVVVARQPGSVIVTAISEGATATLALGINPGADRGTVIGRVLGFEGQPLANFPLRVRGQGSSTQTDGQGNFLLTGITATNGPISITGGDIFTGWVNAFCVELRPGQTLNLGDLHLVPPFVPLTAFPEKEVVRDDGETVPIQVYYGGHGTALVRLNCASAQVSFQSTRPDIATVSRLGSITGLAPGVAEIEVGLDGERITFPIQVISSLPPSTFEGTVVDPNFGQPLPGVFVFIESLGEPVRTDDRGRFRLENIGTGRAPVTLVVQDFALGFTRRLTCVEPQPGGVRDVGTLVLPNQDEAPFALAVRVERPNGVDGPAQLKPITRRIQQPDDAVGCSSSGTQYFLSPTTLADVSPNGDVTAKTNGIAKVRIENRDQFALCLLGFGANSTRTVQGQILTPANPEWRHTLVQGLGQPGWFAAVERNGGFVGEVAPRAEVPAGVMGFAVGDGQILTRCGALPSSNSDPTSEVRIDLSAGARLRLLNVPDFRNPAPTNTPPESLKLSGIEREANGSFTHRGVFFRHPTRFPYVAAEAETGLLLLHPGTFVTAHRGAAVECEIPMTGRHRLRGRFARATNARNAGNGVSVVISRNLDPSAVLLSDTIGANHTADPADPMSGTSVLEFDFEAEFAAGDRIEFIVFADASGRDGTFDATALQFEVLTSDNRSIAAWPGSGCQ